MTHHAGLERSFTDNGRSPQRNCLYGLCLGLGLGSAQSVVASCKCRARNMTCVVRGQRKRVETHEVIGRDELREIMSIQSLGVTSGLVQQLAKTDEGLGEIVRVRVPGQFRYAT